MFQVAIVMVPSIAKKIGAVERQNLQHTHGNTPQRGRRLLPTWPQLEYIRTANPILLRTGMVPLPTRPIGSKNLVFRGTRPTGWLHKAVWIIGDYRQDAVASGKDLAKAMDRACHEDEGTGSGTSRDLTQ